MLNIPNKHKTKEDHNTIKEKAKVQVNRTFKIMNVSCYWNNKEIEEDHHELEISESINDKYEFSKVEKFKILNDNEKVNEATNLEPYCQVRVENIE